MAAFLRSAGAATRSFVARRAAVGPTNAGGAARRNGTFAPRGLKASPRTLDSLRAAMDNQEDESAFCVVDLGQVRNQFKRWKKNLPRVEPFYAVKSNPDPQLMRVLLEMGAGFDCASAPEIDAALDVGAHPSHILYANPCKAKGHLMHAARVGVDTVTVDSVDEFHKLKEVHPDAKCIIRLLVDDSLAKCRLGTKFGAPLETVPELLATASDVGLPVIGFSYHVGSGMSEPSAYGAAVRLAREAFDMGTSAGHDPAVLDIGGGFPAGEGFEPIAAAVREETDLLFPDTQVIAEPGRYFCASSHTLAVNIIGRRVTQRDGRKHVMLFVNEGVYSSFNCLLYDHAVAVPRVLWTSKDEAAVKASSAAPVSTSVWGPTCDGLDRLVEETFDLPDLGVGDWLAFEDWGAYTVAAASTFNGFQLPGRVYLEQDADEELPADAVMATDIVLEEDTENVLAKIIYVDPEQRQQQAAAQQS